MSMVFCGSGGGAVEILGQWFENWASQYLELG